MSTYAPFTSFGDEPNWAVKFSIEHPGNEFPQWESEAVRPTFDMPTITTGGIRRISQTMGRLPWQVSWTLWFDTIAGYEYMDSLVNTRSTLRYLWGATATVGGSMQVMAGREYLVLPNTLLVGLSRPVIAVDGTVEVVATFERPYVAPVIPEPQPWPPPPIPAQPFGYGSGDYGDGPYGYGEAEGAIEPFGSGTYGRGEYGYGEEDTP